MAPWSEGRKKAHAEKMKRLWADGRYRERTPAWTPERRALASSRMKAMISDGSHPGPPPPPRGEANPFSASNLPLEARRAVSIASRSGKKASRETRRRMSEAHRGKKVHSEEFKQALAARNRARTGVFRHSEETKRKISDASAWKATKGDFRYLGWVETRRAGRIGFRSSWELRAVEILETAKDIVSFTYERLTVRYIWEGRKRWTLPDYQVSMADGSMKIVEVKPRGYTYTAKEKAKMAAVTQHCAERGWAYEVWDERLLWGGSAPRGRWVSALPTTWRSPEPKSM